MSKTDYYGWAGRIRMYMASGAALILAGFVTLIACLWECTLWPVALIYFVAGPCMLAVAFIRYRRYKECVNIDCLVLRALEREKLKSTDEARYQLVRVESAVPDPTPLGHA